MLRHVLALLFLLALLLFVLVRHVAPDPYTYDEADYMYAASLGFLANYTDTPALTIADFIGTGLNSRRDSRQTLSQRIRETDDVVFYRHWHGPLYLDLLIPISRLAPSEWWVRSALTVIPSLSLIVIYLGCLWLIPGPRGSLAALLAGALFLSSNSVIHSTELAPHQLFTLLSLCCLVLLAKVVAGGRRIYWYMAMIAAGLAFCTLEIAFVLILALLVCGYVERRRLQVDTPFVIRSAALFLATVFVVWPAAIYKLSCVKAYLFMTYLALSRESPWGHEGFLEVWRGRILDSPLEWLAILAALIFYFRVHAKFQNRLAYPILFCSVLMMAATLRIVSSTARYSLLFMPLLDLFAAVTLLSIPALWSRRSVFITLAAICGLFGLMEYRALARSTGQDPRPPAVLNEIRANGLAEKALLVPQDDLPMIHYYFPRARLRAYRDPQPVPSASEFRPDAIVYRGYPVRIAQPSR